MGIIEDMRKAMKAILKEPRPDGFITIHNPKCKAIKTGEVKDCNCGGTAYRV